ncbi:hypothetical protein HD806DRAFT_547349 [Xylariaceae sp. AK1471]|nr:hypothetical protein HD806DRAFT_547349 [Xylariaceae sp. AK1471]
MAPIPVPSFSTYPIFRASLFLIGFDLKKSLRNMETHPVSGEFQNWFTGQATKQFPDTSSIRKIISSSAVELISALGIVALVVRLVLSDRAGLGMNIEAPILAGFFAIFALITAAITYLACDDLSAAQPLDKFTNERSWMPDETCLLCREADSVANLINLQCSDDEDEAAHPDRALHWYHSECIRRWWDTQDRLDVANDGDNEAQLRALRWGLVTRPRKCPMCVREVLGYRRPYGGNVHTFPDEEDDGISSRSGVAPSALAWAVYSFFSCVALCFGVTDHHWSRGLPYYRGSVPVGIHWSAVLTRGVMPYAMLILSRLFLLRILYLCSLWYVQMQTHIASPDSIHYQAPLPSFPESIAIVASFIVCVHGVARRLAEILYLPVPHRVHYTGLPKGAFGTAYKVWGNRILKFWKALYRFLIRYADVETLAVYMMLYSFSFTTIGYILAFNPPDGRFFYLMLLGLFVQHLIVYVILFVLILLPICVYITFAVSMPIWALFCTVKEAVGTLITPVAKIWVVRYYGVPYLLYVARLALDGYFEDRWYVWIHRVGWTTVELEKAEWISSTVICHRDVFSILGWAWYVF